MTALGTRRKQLRPGDTLDGRYELLYPYAQGGMATVWLARVRGKHGFEKLYAVKTILPHLASDTAFRNMFLDEARIAARIRHTNVAEIEDLGEDDGHLYMVLEWLQGDAWSKLVGAIIERGDPIPADLMLHIAAQTCAGLHAAHELADDHGRPLHVVHRDVSPQNIMVGEGGVVKVIDFGVAKAVGRASEATRTGLIKGKLEYLAPEVAFGKNVDRRADVWAVGATLYQMFAGRPTYPGKNDLDILKRISSGKPPRALPTTVPQPIADVIMGSLQPDVARRTVSAYELKRQLEAVMAYPISSEDVARAVRHYLKPRIESRHASIAEALREAAARATQQGAAPAPIQPHLLPPRHSFPTLPPEAAPVRSQSIVLSPEHSSAFGNNPTVPATPGADSANSSASLRPLHLVMVILATLVTLSVWSLVVFLALRSQSAMSAPPFPPSPSSPASSGAPASHGG